MDTILVFRMRRYDSWHVKIDALNAAAEKHGCRLQVIDQPATESAVRKLLDFWHPSGVIVVETPERKRPFPRELFGRTPTVFLDCEPDFATPGLPCLLHNTHAICADAIRELLDIGCTDIAYVGWYDRAYWCEDKRTACREILALHGKEYRELIPTPREAKDAALLNKRLCTWLRKLPRPCGILAVNDTIAELVLAAAAACSIDIPSDLAVLGVDDDRSIGERMTPTLSSFTLDYSLLADAVFVELKKRGRERTHGRVLVRSFKLIRRQSSRRFKRKDAEAEAAVELEDLAAGEALVLAPVRPLEPAHVGDVAAADVQQLADGALADGARVVEDVGESGRDGRRFAVHEDGGDLAEQLAGERTLPLGGLGDDDAARTPEIEQPADGGIRGGLVDDLDAPAAPFGRGVQRLDLDVPAVVPAHAEDQDRIHVG